MEENEEIFFITLSSDSYTSLSQIIIDKLSSLRREGLLKSFQINFKQESNQLWITLYNITGDIGNIKKIILDMFEDEEISSEVQQNNEEPENFAGTYRLPQIGLLDEAPNFTESNRDWEEGDLPLKFGGIH